MCDYFAFLVSALYGMTSPCRYQVRVDRCLLLCINGKLSLSCNHGLQHSRFRGKELQQCENIIITRSFCSHASVVCREMIASLNICAAVHGTVDDNMAVHGIGGDNEEETEGKGPS